MNEQTTPATPLVSLSTLMTPSKTVSIDFPDMEGFSVDLCYLARDELMKLRSRCLKQKFNKKTRAFEETLDENIFLVEYVKSIIKGWKGLKYKYLKELMLVDVESMSEDDALPFTRENAELLMKNSLDFDTWVTETVGDLENFTKTK
tara:strand:+ start:399 stop:839 length:441 start_codon:yes stop_codon:yes gene_type:complete